jgi:hypothetical protein
MMAALRAALLLDRDETKLSFQTIHRRLKSKAVQSALKQSLGDIHDLGEFFPPSRDQLIAGFLEAHAEMDWEVHSRLTHFWKSGYRPLDNRNDEQVHNV